jgi:hypothetical protein
MTTSPPLPFDSCTLPAAERPLRQSEFDDLFATLVTGDRIGPGHLRLVLAAPVDQVRDLADRETACCSFFSFSVGTAPSGVVLEISVPLVRAPALDAIVARLPRALP